MLVAESEGNVGNGKPTCTLQQKGDNYIQVEEDKEKIDYRQNVLVYSNEFVDGAYFDLNSNNQMRTDGSYGSIKSAHTLIPRKDITIKVKHSDLSKYCVTLSWFDKDGKYLGRNEIWEMPNGVVSFKASAIQGEYFRVSVYLYPGFAKVPADAQITVYKGANYDGPEVSYL